VEVGFLFSFFLFLFFCKGKHPFEDSNEKPFFQNISAGKYETLNTSHLDELKNLVYQMIHVVFFFFFYFVLYKTLIYIYVYFLLKIFN
jgi:hypothetical protein